MGGALIDNDVVIKIAAYRLGTEFLARTTIAARPPAMLNVGRFVVQDRLRRTKRFADPAAALQCLDQFLPHMILVEPTQQEIELAAELEMAASQARLEFDVGESQLVSILLSRAETLLITGDKRAIAAIGSIIPEKMQGRTACLEQLLTILAHDVGAGGLSHAVCREPGADTAISICCRCASGGSPSLDDLLHALTSYVEHMRQQSNGVLIHGEVLSALSS